ncbi:MAG: nucleotidyltransferase [Chloroflexi bacterium]|nr:MAG: nucleotidyltransferase [Chloroflexota bacterium]
MYALIIAGGEGERLRPLTDDRPKNMVPVAGRPIVERQLEWLRENDVTDAVFLCGYKADVLQAHVGDGSSFGVRVQYSVETEPLGRGGALKLGFALVPEGEEPIIAINGDILTDQTLAEMIESHEARAAVASVMLTPLKSPYGVVDVEEDGRITSFREKPVLPYWINAGIYVLSRSFFALLPEVGDHETETFPALATEGKLFGFKSEAYWRPVDSIKDVSEAERELAVRRG